MVVLPLSDGYFLLVLQNRVLHRLVDLLRSKHEPLGQEDVQKLQFGHRPGLRGEYLALHHPKGTKKDETLSHVTIANCFFLLLRSCLLLATVTLEYFVYSTVFGDN